MVPPRPTRRRRRSSEPTRLLLALALALLWHALLVGVVILNGRLFPAAPPEPKQEVALRTLSADDWLRNRGGPPAQQQDSRQPVPRSEQAPKKPDEKQEEVRPPGPVVAVPPGNNQVPQTPDAFAAETDNRVEKQTIARDRTTKWKNAQSRTTATEERQGPGADEAQAAQLGGNEGRGDDDRPLTPGGRPAPRMEIPDASPRQEIALKPTDQKPGDSGPKVSNQRSSEALEGNSHRLRIEEGQEGGQDGAAASEGRRGSRGMASLLPSSAAMDQIVGTAPSDLKDDDIPEGDGTFLNTREWKYASFFNRVKQGVSWAWEPGSQLMRRDPSGSVYGGRDRLTVLSVTLDAQGNLKDVEVQRSSGLDFLDHEAVKAFEKAQPFPRPPPGMMKEGVVAFTFSFYLDMGGTPRFRFTVPR